MKKPILFLLAIVLVAFSCKKDEDPTGLPFEEQLAIDLQKISSYFEENSITNVNRDCNTVFTAKGEPCAGFVYYILQEEGNGITPIQSDNIEVSYIGRLMDTNEEFDGNENIDFNLSGLISGWQAILLDLQEGDSVTMYIPSVYAYGFNGSGENVPSNSNLIFEMKLHTVNP